MTPTNYTALVQGGRQFDIGLPMLINGVPHVWRESLALAKSGDYAFAVDEESPNFLAWYYANRKTDPGFYCYSKRPDIAAGETAHVAKVQSMLAEARDVLGTRRIFAYLQWPLAFGAQYGVDQEPYVKDNRRADRIGVYRGFDAMAVSLYLSEGQGEKSVRDYVTGKIVLSSAFTIGKSVWLSPHARDGKRSLVPIALNRLAYQLCVEQGWDVVWWDDQVNDGNVAAVKAYVLDVIQ